MKRYEAFNNIEKELEKVELILVKYPITFKSERFFNQKDSFNMFSETITAYKLVTQDEYSRRKVVDELTKVTKDEPKLVYGKLFRSCFGLCVLSKTPISGCDFEDDSAVANGCKTLTEYFRKIINDKYYINEDFVELEQVEWQEAIKIHDKKLSNFPLVSLEPLVSFLEELGKPLTKEQIDYIHQGIVNNNFKGYESFISYCERMHKQREELFEEIDKSVSCKETK